MIHKLTAQIKEGKRFKHYKDVTDNSKLYKAYYTGEKLTELITKYRINETAKQKEQRDRITIKRTKHVCSQIENILDQLQTLDSPAINIDIDSESKKEQIEQILYNLNITEQAFNYVKYYNIVDPNSFLICSVNEFNEPEFDIVESHDVYSFNIKNDRVEYLVISLPEHKYRIYTENSVYDFQFEPGKTMILLKETPTNLCYAYHLGYIHDSRTMFKTFKSILDPASEMMKQLTWDGSEYDVIKALHGIVKQFAYAPKCEYRATEVDKYHECIDGILYVDHSPTKSVCPSCNGSGMRIHTSSQDVIFLPEPKDPNQVLSLDKLTHTVFIPDSLLESRKKDIDETEDKIIRTVFNSNNVTQDEVVKTATEMTIDLKGVYSALTKLGKKVSETFIWMVETICDINQVDLKSVFHGYSMDLNLESVDSIMLQRQKAVQSGVPFEVIKNIDRALMKKQHIDSPEYIDKVETWETFKPFNDKTAPEKISIISMLPDDNREKVLYVYWYKIQTNIKLSNPDFYDFPRETQQKLIDDQIDLIISMIPKLTESSFEDFA